MSIPIIDPQGVETSACDCGNPLDDELVTCLSCAEIEALIEAQQRPHDWTRGRMTGALTCAACHLLPIEPDDYYTDCQANGLPTIEELS